MRRYDDLARRQMSDLGIVLLRRTGQARCIGKAADLGAANIFAALTVAGATNVLPPRSLLHQSLCLQKVVNPLGTFLEIPRITWIATKRRHRIPPFLLQTQLYNL
jgi:hypothetical protein